MKWFFEALRKYAVFSGRSMRKEYWYFVLFYFLTVFLASIITAFLAKSADMINIVYDICVLIFFIPSLAVGVRRMHDIDKSGWFVIVPIYNIILACTNGTVGPNEYGPDPKGGVGYGADDYERPFEATLD